jgi:hypothetical protein
MYVAPQSDKDWLLSVQRRLHMLSRENLDYVFLKLWGFITDARNLRIAFRPRFPQQGARDRGRRRGHGQEPLFVATGL